MPTRNNQGRWATLFAGRGENHSSRKGGIRSVIAFVTAIAMLIVGVVVGSAQADTTWTVDPSTQDSWYDDPVHGVSVGGDDFSSENTGRVWTDKTVYGDGDAELANVSDTSRITVTNDHPGTALVGLSALSSTTTVTGTEYVRKPLDIVIVVDTSNGMTDSLESHKYTPVYADDLDESATYYIQNEDGTDTEVTHTDRGWVTENGDVVTPATAEGDGGTVLNSRETIADSGVQRVQGLTEAVNRFIDQNTVSNEGIAEDQENRIAVVATGGPMTDDAVDPTIQEYTDSSTEAQATMTSVVANLTADGESLKEDVGELFTPDPNNTYGHIGGPASAIDYAMQKAQTALNGKGSRLDAQKVVVVFTTGTVSHQGFDSWGSETPVYVAGNAINTAKGMKEDGVTIYGVGVYTGAEPDDFNTPANAVINGISSAYPDANWSGDRFSPDSISSGDKSTGADYVFKANDSATLNKVFELIQQTINNAAKSPITTSTGSGPGSITFTDTLGDYMEVKDFNSIVYAGKRYTTQGEPVHNEDGSITYKFTDNIASPNPIYPSGDLESIDITVRPGATLQAGDTVTVTIPESLLPMRVYKAEIENGKLTTSHTEAYPIRVFYNVGLKTDALNALDDPTHSGLSKDDATALQSYMNNHKNADGTIKFYSNSYGKTGPGTDGLTTATFTPAKDNSFYYFTEDTPLLSKQDPDSVVTGDIDPNATYYYQNRYFVTDDASWHYEYVAVPGDSVLLSNSGNLKPNDKGEVQIKEGTPHYQRADEFSSAKSENKTNTAGNAITPSWDGSADEAHSVTVKLGNNGFYQQAIPGRIKVSKTVDWNGYADTAQKFTFTVNFNGDQTLEGDYTYKVYNTKDDSLVQNAGGTVADGGKIELGDGQYAVILGLPAGTTYTITETNLPAGFGSDQTNNTVSGEVESGETQEHAFKNTYTVNPAKKALSVTKTIDGRDWKDGESYTFTLVADQTDNATKTAWDNDDITFPNDAESLEVTIEQGTEKHTATFGDITFHKAGDYKFTITETIPADATNPNVKGENGKAITYGEANADQKAKPGWQLNGVTYDGSTKTVTIHVEPDGKGGLTATVSNGSSDPSTFTNTYKSTGTSADLKGTKAITGRDFQSGDSFTFQVTGESTVSPVPMPSKVGSNGQITISPESGKSAGIDFGTITFTEAGTYTYTFSEVEPENGKVPGVGYDKDSVTVVIEVTDNNDGTLKVEYKLGDKTVNANDVNAALAWQNDYKANPTTANISGTKTLTGRDSKNGEKFTFKLTPTGDTVQAVADGKVVLDSNKSTTLTTDVSDLKNGVKKAFSFNNIQFTAAGEYTFQIKESVDKHLGGMTYDDHTATVKVTVSEDTKTATLHVDKVEYGTDNAAPDFTNTYETTPTDYDFKLSGKKTMDVESGDFTLQNGQFTFVMKSMDGAPLPTGDGLKAVDTDDDGTNDAVTVTNGNPTDNNTALYQFAGKIKFPAAGTYTYQVTERHGDTAGVSYASTTYTVTYTVSDDDNGGLKVTDTKVTKDNDSETDIDTDKLDFTNTFTAGEVTGTQTINKHLIGRTMDANDKFTFQVVAAAQANGQPISYDDMAKPADMTGITANEDGNGYTYTTTVSPTGNQIGSNDLSFTLPQITYTKAGTYTYTITETDTDAAGMTYDTTTYVVVVTIEQNGDKLTRKAEIHKGSATGDVVTSVIFNNKFKTTGDLDGDTYLKVSKSISGRPWNANEQYTFTIAGVSNTAGLDSNPMPDETTLTFGGTAGSETAVEKAFGNIHYTVPGTYTYRISENEQNGDGITSSKATYLVTVTANDDDHDGQMTVTATMQREKDDTGTPVTENAVPGGTASFTNTYTTQQQTSGAIAVSKTLTGRAWEAGDAFGFTLAADPEDQDTLDAVEDGTVVLPANATTLQITNSSTDGTDGAKTASFGDITFTAEGTYKFIVRETDPGEGHRVPGVDYDDAVKHVTFVVSDNGNGQLTVSKSEDSDELSFENNYTATQTELGFTVRKTIPSAEWTADGYTGRPWNEGEEYTFTLAEAESNDETGYTMPTNLTTTVSAPESGTSNTATFGNITFTKAGTYHFTITENAGPQDTGMTYDQHETKVTVKVSDIVDGKHTGQLTATATYDNADAPNPTDASETTMAAYTNVYKPSEGKLEGKTNLPVTKSLGRPWQQGDVFTFTLALDAAQSSTTPAIGDIHSAVVLPENAGGLDITGEVGTSNNATGSFGDITFKMPGTYVFTVTETVPSDATNPSVNNGETKYGDANPTERAQGGWQYNGITYDSTPRTVTVNVTDNHNGQLVATLQGEVKLTFTNNYGATGVLHGNTDLVVQKELGRKWAEGDSFTFTISGVSGTDLNGDNFTDSYLPMPGQTSVVITNGSADVEGATNTKTANFGDITYTRTGIFTYQIVETPNVTDEDAETPGIQHNGITYSQAVYQVEVRVTDAHGTGELTVDSAMTRVKDQDGTELTPPETVDNALFENDYNTTGTLYGSTDLKVSKTLSGRDWGNAEKFTFTLTADDADQPMPAGSSNGTATLELTKPAEGNTANGNFGDIEYTKTGTYTYTITEEGTDGNGLIYSKAEYTVTVTVTDPNHDGKLDVKSEMKQVKNDAGGDADTTVDDKTASFTNDYKVTSTTFQIPVTKVIQNRDLQDGDTFEFTIKPSGDTVTAVENGTVVMPENTKATIAWADGDTGFTKDGLFDAITFNAPGEYTFDVKETAGKIDGMTYDNTVKTVTVNVTDNLDGTLTATLAEGTVAPTFTNISEPVKDVDKGDKVKPNVTSNGELVAVGDKLTYSIDWTNTALDKNGDPAAATVTITDKIPEGTKLVEGTISNGGKASDGTITWSFQADAGASGTVSFTVKVTEDAYDLEANTIENQATVQIGNNPGVQTNPVKNPVPEKDVDAGDKADTTISADGQYVAVGDKLTYSIDWTNATVDKNGDPAAATVTITDKIPEGTKLVEGTISNGGKASDGTITWSFQADAGASGTVSFTVEVTADALDLAGSAGSKVENQATVQIGNGSEVQTNPVDNPVPSAGQVVVPVTKVIENRKFQEGDSFEFTIEPSGDDTKAAVENGNVEMPTDTTATIAWAEGDDTFQKNGQFDAITFNAAGTYTFDVKETKGELGGMTYDTTVKTVTVNVTDDGNGRLTASLAADTDTTFTNTYQPTGTTTVASFGLTKAFTGTTWDTEEFTFNLAGSEGAPMPKDAEGNDVTSVTVGADDVKDGVAPIEFGEITYDRIGTYTYTITEANGGQTIDGIHYDGHKVVVTVSVTDNLHGGFTAAVTNVTGDKQFTNEYGTELDVDNGIQIVKNLTGHDIADDQFEFTVTAQDEASAKKAGFKDGAMSQVVKVNAATMDGDGTATAVMPILSGMHFTDGEHDATYTYTVEETKIGGSGYTNDTDVKTVAIKVADDGNGTLTVTTTVTNGDGTTDTYINDNRGNTATAQVTFNNSYQATGSATIKGTKHLENGQLSGNDFQFQIVNDKSGQVVSTGTNDAAGTVNFDAIDYTVTQLIADYTADTPAVDYNDATDTYTYHYTVSEVTPLPDGVTAQDASFKVMVNLKDNGDGTLQVDVVYPDGTPDTGLAFRNSYGDNAKATVNVSGDKMLALADPSLNPPDITGKFTFTLSGVDENGAPAPLPDNVTATNDGTGTVEFGDIVYTMENTFGTTSGATTEGVEGNEGIDTQIAQRTKTFTYTVTESGSVDGVTNDAQATRTFTVTVTDNGDGTLDAVCSETPGDQFSFTNTYSVEPVQSTPDIEITKQLTGREIQDGEFGFQMSGVSAPDGVDPAASVLTASNVGTDIDFGDITFAKPGEYVYAISEIPGERGGVTYDGAVYFATATVTDNQDGTLSVAWTYTDADGEAIAKDDGIAFKNTYEAAPVPVTLGATKVLDGRELKDGEFTFELTDGKNGDGEQAPMPGDSQETTVTATNAADGTITFDPITFDKVGTYTYTMREVAGDEEGMTYDDTEYSIVITVIDDGEGNLVATTAMLNGSDEVDGIVFENTYEAPAKPNEEMPGTGSALAPVMLLTVLLLAAGAAVTLKRRNQ